MRLHIYQLETIPALGEYPNKPRKKGEDFSSPMLIEQIEAELPDKFENLDYVMMDLWDYEVKLLRNAYEGKLFSFADDGGNWIKVSKEQKETAKKYWEELKQEPLPDAFQVITWRFDELGKSMDPETFEGFFDIQTWQFVEWIAEVAMIDTEYHFAAHYEAHF